MKTHGLVGGIGVAWLRCLWPHRDVRRKRGQAPDATTRLT
jgi:hypothetical protein